MHIIHPINDFLFELFPKAKAAGKDLEVLRQEAEDFYTVGSFKPTISIIHGIVDITIEGELIEQNASLFKLAAALCDGHRFEEAKKRLEPLLKEAPHISEYHRILGQILSGQGEQDKAINSLLDALRWDPKNEKAIIKIGNILIRHQHNTEAAMKYYEYALQHKQDDVAVLTRIGLNLIQYGWDDVARHYLDRAFDINPAYPNMYYAFALIAESEHNYKEMFELSVVALFKNPRRDQLYRQSLKLVINAANEIIDPEVGGDIINAFAEKLEGECGKKIVVEEDASLKTGAKIEFAENYERNYHLLKYNPGYTAVHHLIMHELAHLLFASRARAAGTNKLFVRNDELHRKFLDALEKDAQKHSKKGFYEAVIRQYFTALFDELNSQIYNTPIDLFIEDYLFQNYPDLMPYQFLSLYSLIDEGFKATPDEKIMSVAPPSILTKSNIYNLVSALHFLKRYGVDLIEKHNPTKQETIYAEKFYNEYVECQGSYTPGDEYKLVQKWALNMHLQNYFSLVNETDYREHSDLLECLCATEHVDMPDSCAAPQANAKIQLITEEHKSKDINMAVTRFMVEALRYFKTLTAADINAIAIEIALLVQAGISPEKVGYTVKQIAGKAFSGYQLLAYYYVSWAQAFPEQLADLQLQFEKEYEFALEMVE